LRKLVGEIALLLLAISVSVVSIGYYVYEQGRTSTTPTMKIRLGGVILTVELATTPAEQERGLSGRSSMPADHGMLFIFNQQAEWSFWMYEMMFPLDIIWFNANMKAVFIEQDLPPCTPSECQVFTPPVNALYVLEVNAGFVKTNDVSLGDSFAFV
jgi:hypothetical protein